MNDYRQETSPSFHLNHAWNTAMSATYHEVVIEYGNDGPIENDRQLPAAEQEARDQAVAALARDTGVHPDFVRDHIENNAWAYGQANCDDATADACLRPPDWSDMTDWYEAATENTAIRNGVDGVVGDAAASNGEGDGS